jgi:hypothetical protein
MKTNIVYAHIAPDEERTVEYGGHTFQFSREAIPGCVAYLYLNSYSFKQRQPGFNFLFLSEPVVVTPEQYNFALWDCFDHIFTHFKQEKTLSCQSSHDRNLHDSGEQVFPCTVRTLQQAP